MGLFITIWTDINNAYARGPTMLTILDSDYSILGPEIVGCILTFLEASTFFANQKIS